MAKTKKEATPSLTDMLGKIATESVPTSKNPKKKYPIIQLGKEDSDTLKKFLKAKKDFKESKAVMELEEQPLLDLVRKEQRKLALEGEYNGTFEIVTKRDENNKEEQLEVSKFISADKFTVTDDPEVLQEFKEVVKDDYKELIVETTTAMIKPSVLEDKKLQAEFVKLIGEKNLGRFLDVVVKRSTCPGFDEKRFKYGAEALEVIDRAVKQTKPYIK